MTPPNTTPLNEEDRLGEIKKIILESGVLDEHDKNVGGDLYSSKGNQELTADALAQYIAPNITKLIQTLEKKAYENGLHDGEQVATFVFIKRLQARKKNTAPNSGAGREIKDLLKELEK